MKRRMMILLAVLLFALGCLPVYGADGRVTYSGDAGEFIFGPGSDASPTDLFPTFKDVMPGDTLTQHITVRNDASRHVKVKIYLRSLGAQEGSEEFLSQLGLKVRTSENNTMAYMFQAAASETAQLSDWVCLGTLYSGGEVNLDVILTVPVELDNRYSDKVGYLDWEFKIEEFPVESDDPEPPPTGDDSSLGTWMAVSGVSFLLILLLIFRRRRESEDRKEASK